MPPASPEAPAPVRVALVGAGKIAKMHVSAIRQAGGELVGVCDRDEQQARRLTTDIPGARAFADLGEMLTQTRPQVVHVLTPPATHGAIARQVAEAGGHALVEKPMALSAGDADDMLATAREHGVLLVPNHNYLCKPSVVRARRLVEGGEIGDVVHVEAYYGLSDEANSYAGAGGAHWAYRLPGGVFTNFLPHVVYLQAAFLGGIGHVSGVSTARMPGSGEGASELTVLLDGPSASGVITISMRARPYAKFVRIYGTKGIVHADLVGEVTTVHRQRRLPRLFTKALFNLELVPQLARGTVVNSAKVVTGSMRNMPDLHAFVAELYDAVRTGGTPPARGEDGRMVIDVMERIWERMPDDRPVAAAPAGPIAPRTSVERRLLESGELRDRVLVTGASGLLGRNVVSALARSGAEVRAFVRDATRVPRDVERDAEVVVGNLTDEASLRMAMEGVDRVVHCAAITTNNVPYLLHQETNVDGTAAVLAAARATGVRRLVHLSSVAVYGMQDTDAELAESAELPEASDRWAYYQRSKLAAERIARTDGDGDLEVVVLRPGILYGQGAEGPVKRGLIQLGGVRLTLGSGGNALPLIYVDNAVDGVLLALTAPAAAGGVFNLVDAPQRSVRDVAKEAIAVTGEATRLVPVPTALLRAMAGKLEERAVAAEAQVPPRLSRFQIASATRDLRYDTSAARRELGWEPEVQLREGLRRTFGLRETPAAPAPVVAAAVR